MRIPSLLVVCVIPSLAVAQAIQLPVVQQNGNVYMSDDGSTVLLRNERVLWSPVDPPVSVPVDGVALNATGQIVLYLPQGGIGFWGPELGHQVVSLSPYPCEGGISHNVLAPDGTWASGIGNWAMAGQRYCYWRANHSGMLDGGLGRASSQISSVSLDNQGTVQVYFTFDLDQFGRTTSAVLCWSGGGCVSVAAIEEAPYAGISVSKISGAGNVAFVNHNTGLRQLLYRHDSTGAADLITPLYSGTVSARDLSFDGQLALLYYSGGSGSYYLYDHKFGTQIPLASILVNSGHFPSTPTLSGVEMDWSGTIFTMRARLTPQQPYRWYYVNLGDRCPFDLDYTFATDSDDIIEFFRLYEEARADFDLDGDTDADDVIAFFAGWDAGC